MNLIANISVYYEFSVMFSYGHNHQEKLGKRTGRFMNLSLMKVGFKHRPTVNNLYTIRNFCLGIRNILPSDHLIKEKIEVNLKVCMF